jgi:heterodisulfide reductase subunit C
MNKQELMVKVNEDGFLDEICSLPGGECVRWCMQCGMCSASCPNISQMDYSPRKVIALIRAGKRYEVLNSNSMWICASCYLCTVRCPKDVKPTELMHILQCLAEQHGLVNGKTRTSVMHHAFIDMVKGNGRACELALMIKFYLRTNPFAMLKMAPLGLKLVLRGRMPLRGLLLRGEKIKGTEELRTIIDKAHALGGVK